MAHTAGGGQTPVGSKQFAPGSELPKLASVTPDPFLLLLFGMGMGVCLAAAAPLFPRRCCWSQDE